MGAFDVGLGTVTMTGAWAEGRPVDGGVGHRSASPWGDRTRRPSHEDERRAWPEERLGSGIRAARRPGAPEAELAAAAERRLRLAA